MTIQSLHAAAENITLLPIPNARQRTKKFFLIVLIIILYYSIYFYSKYRITTPGLLERQLQVYNQLSLELAFCSFMSFVSEV